MKRILFFVVIVLSFFQNLFPIVFVNATEKTLRVVVVLPMGGQRVKNPQDYTWAHILPAKREAVWEGRLSGFNVQLENDPNPMNRLTISIRSILEYLLEQPELEINFVQNPDGTLAIKPTSEELQSLAEKEFFQPKAKPIIHQEIPNLPGGVKNIITEYYTPFTESYKPCVLPPR